MYVGAGKRMVDARTPCFYNLFKWHQTVNGSVGWVGYLKRKRGRVREGVPLSPTVKALKSVKLQCHQPHGNCISAQKAPVWLCFSDLHLQYSCSLALIAHGYTALVY